MGGDRRTAEWVHPEGAVRPPPGGTLWTIQVLRGAAAAMVVIGHSQSAAAGIAAAAGRPFARATVLPWGAGVDLFFVISGFIMVHASRRLFGETGARAEFLRRRLVRIVPLYWLATTLMLALLAAASWKGGDPFPRTPAILAAYAFLPADTYGNGALFPVLDLGWTLNYEMFFYALFAIAIGWRRGRALAAATAMLVGVTLAGGFVPDGSMPWFWTRPIVLDFGMGLGLGWLVARGVTLSSGWRTTVAALGAALLVADPAHLFNGAPGVTVANAWPRVVFAGLPFALLLGGALLGREPRMPRLAVPLTRIGDASYSLYLFHPFALIVIGKAAQKLGSVAAAPGWLLILATLALALAVGFAVHHGIERPVTALVARIGDRRSACHHTLAHVD